MAVSAERRIACLVMSGLGGVVCAQPGSTFAYTGEDAVLDALNTQHAHFGGLTNSVLVIEDEEQDFVWPFLPAIFFEYNYLVLPRNHTFNVNLGATPEINLFPWFMGRATALAELSFLAEADNKPGQGFGLRLGGGFTALGSTFRLIETSPVLRAGFVVDNIRITYMYSTAKPIYINHQIGVGIKFDW